MAGRSKPRASRSTVQRWLREGIAPRTFERLVRDLAPSKGTGARWAREGRIPERALLSIKPPRPAPVRVARAATVHRWLEKGIPARTFDRLVRELAPSKSTGARWRREGIIPAMRLEAIAFEPVRKPKKKRKRPERYVELPPAPLPPIPVDATAEELERAREEIEEARAEVEQARADAFAEREAIQAEAAERRPVKAERPFEDEGAPEPPGPEDCYPLPSRKLDFFRAHDRTEMEGITGIHFDPVSGRITGVDDKGQKVAAYLFTEENGQPKSGPDSLRWALAKDLEGYVAHISRAIRERYGDSTMRGVFGCFDMPEAA